MAMGAGGVNRHKAPRKYVFYEKAVRPYDSIYSLSRPRKVEPVVVVPEALLVWGSPADFQEAKFSFPEKAKDPGLSFTVIEWSEVNRTTVTVRITNPDDAEQFVDVERVDEIEFKEPKSGDTFKLLLRDHSDLA